MNLGDREYNLMRRLEDLLDSWPEPGNIPVMQVAVLLRKIWSEQHHGVPPLQPVLTEYPTGEARIIFERLLPEWEELFLRKNRQYKATGHLGPKGVFPEINRKTGALKTYIWDGDPVPDYAEGPREVMLDLIGHLFLMLALLDEVAEEVEHTKFHLTPQHPGDDIPSTGEVAGDPSEEDDYDPDNPFQFPDPQYAGFADLPDEIQSALRKMTEPAVSGLSVEQASAVREYIGEGGF